MAVNLLDMSHSNEIVGHSESSGLYNFNLFRSNSVESGEFMVENEDRFVNETVNNDVPAITLRDLSIIPLQTLDDHAFGKRKKWSELGWVEILFMILALLSTGVVMAFTITRAVSTKGSVYTLNIISTVHAVFCIFYTIHGIIAERPVELMLLVFGWLTLMTYVTILCVDLTAGSYWIYACLIFIWTFGPGNIILGCYHGKLYHESRYVIFRAVGANLKLQDAAQTAFTALSLIIFDLQLELSATLLFPTRHPSQSEAITLAVGFCLIIFGSSLAYFSVRFEDKKLSIAYFVFSVLQPGYIIYGLCLKISRTKEEKASLSLSVVFGVLVAVALIVRIILVYKMYRVYKNFGIGVKEKVFGNGSRPMSAAMLTQPVYSTFTGASWFK